MLTVEDNVRIFMALGPTDMRKSITGLSLIVEDEFDGQLFKGDYFVFCNRNKSIVKILYWERSGFCLWMKRLEKERFKWPQRETDLMEIRSKELMWLLDGLDIGQAHEKLDYEVLL